MISWFCKSYGICKECHVHFEPTRHVAPRFADLCDTHRKLAEDAHDRRERVAAWAIRNMDKVEPMMLADEHLSGIASQAALQAAYGGLGAQAASPYNASILSNMGGLAK